MLSLLGLCHRSSHLEGYNMMNSYQNVLCLGLGLCHRSSRLESYDSVDEFKTLLSLLGLLSSFPLLGQRHLPGEADGLGIALIELHDKVYDAAGDLIDGPNNDELPPFDKLHDVLVCRQAF